MSKHSLFAIMLGFSLAISSALATADTNKDYPTKTIHIIVPFSAGGGTDTYARILAKTLRNETNQSVVVNDRPGAGGEIGATAIQQAPPDGYHLGLLSMTTFLILPMYRNASYDVDQFRYVSSFTESGLVLIIKKSDNYHNLKQFISYAKKHPGRVTISISGDGKQYLLLKIAQQTGAKFAKLKFNGAGASFNALLNGTVDATLITQKFVKQAQEKKSLKAIAYSGEMRSQLFSDIPTFKENGIDTTNLNARVLVTPKNVSPKVFTQIRKLTNKIGTSNYLKKLSKDAGYDYKYRDHKDTLNLIQSYRDKAGSVVKKNKKAFKNIE